MIWAPTRDHLLKKKEEKKRERSLWKQQWRTKGQIYATSSPPSTPRTFMSFLKEKIRFIMNFSFC